MTNETTSVKDRTEENTKRGRSASYFGCLVQDCEEKHYAKQYCRKHYAKFRTYGDPLHQQDFINSGKECHCGKPAQSRGMCKAHYMAWWSENAEQKPVDEGHHNFKAENVTYATAHYRVRRAKGSARDYQCLDCDNMATDWCLIVNPSEKHYGYSAYGRKPTTAFSLNPDDYEPRCSDCHKAYDAKHGNRSYKTGRYAQVNGGAK
ncbi:hypothetical protein [Nocardioides abyssi]|uniref:HNH endonuclease n=1 Tax=Nocardioides abyssi TaxID=3058370 RepID=A0ABT8EY55_9ACTN|nr:hypothetical protein [Nocardioides abyssi]MDN4162954.1 hypothetical protein [Nocardioides abyssi]